MQMGRSETSGMVMARMRTAHLWLQVWEAVGAWVGSMLPLSVAIGGGLPPRATIFSFFFLNGLRMRLGSESGERRARPGLQ